MPVSDATRLHALAHQLTTASTAQDWERLGQLDRLLAQWVALPPEVLPEEPAVQAAWQQLVEAHKQARKACQQALFEAGTRLSDLQNHNEAHKAYAWQEQFS